MPFTIFAGIILLLLLLIKSKRHKPFIKKESLKIGFLICSLLLIFSGIGFTFVLLIKGSGIKKIDYSIAAFLLGIAITGFVAETPKESTKKK